MKVEYDASVDAAYISLENDAVNMNFGHTYTCDSIGVGGQINLDFSDSGVLIGIEVLQASKKLPKYLLTSILNPSNGA